MRPKIADSTANFIKVLVAAHVSNGSLDQARELVEAVRIACDEATAAINAAARKEN